MMNDEFTLSDSNKQDIRQNLKLKLSLLGENQGKLRKTDEFAFIIMLVEYLWSMDVGISFTQGGACAITNSGKLSVFSKSGGMFDFITSLVILRNKLVTSFGVKGVFEEIERLWCKSELGVLCYRLGINFNDPTSTPEYARLMEGE